MKRISWMSFAAVFVYSLIPTIVAAQDLALPQENLWFDTKMFTEGKKVRIYATAENPGAVDLKGVVRFFDGERGPQLKGDQPVSVVQKKEDTVFIDIIFAVPGDHEIVAKLFPFDADEDNPANNVAKRTITVLRDFDRDGSPDAIDLDDDNDGVPDSEDAFPQNEKESKDTDGDGIGDNTDPDDDNDGVPDKDDAFPLDADESKDTDGDGVGDKKDAFPQDPTESRDLDGDGVGDNKDKDADGDGIEKTNDINDQNLGPKIALSGVPLYVKPNQEITLDVSSTEDPDGSLREIFVTVGEQKTDLSISQQTTKFQFPKTGKYSIKVEAIDDQGESRIKTYNVTVGSPFLFMGLLFLALLILILAIFGIFTYAHRTRKKFWKTDMKSLKKLTKKVKKFL